MAILADVAPCSREYHTYRQKVGKQAQGNTELEIEYERILNRVKKTRESVIRMQDRHSTAPVDEISGTVRPDLRRRHHPQRISRTDIPVFLRVHQRRRYVGAGFGDNQVSPSCRTTKPSRVRERPAPIHNFRTECVNLSGQSFCALRVGMFQSDGTLELNERLECSGPGLSHLPF